MYMACSCSCMPGANEVLGCPYIFHFFLTKYFPNCLPKFLTTIFSPSPYISHFFSFSHFFKFTKIQSLMPPMLHHAPLTTFFSYFFSHLPTFLKKTGPLDALQGGRPGRRTVRSPLCTPLMAWLPIQTGSGGEGSHPSSSLKKEEGRGQTSRRALYENHSCSEFLIAKTTQGVS